MRPEAILVVDDNEDDVFLLKHALQVAGIINPVQVIDNGRDAIAYLEGTGKFEDREAYPYPSFLLLDLHLPLETGCQVLEWLRKTYHPDLKVVVCTGTATPAEMEWAYKLGAERVFEKTPDFGAFVREFEKLPGVQVHSERDTRELVFT